VDPIDDGTGTDPQAGDEPFAVPEPPVTGDPAVDGATQRVAETAGQPLDDQVAAYDAVHRTLQDRLADVED
jgi:hypothetical protein